jgi:Swt1-like HEPN
MNDKIDVPELPERVLRTYSRLWQLETWLRRLVYVELRALLGDDWKAIICDTTRPREADKRLTHMPTPEDDPLSYAPFAELCRIIDDKWDIFARYFPPKPIWSAKLEEIKQIRNRVAHFRVGHEDDLPRVVQLLRDIDKGVWTFCTSYNDPIPVLPQSDDPVVDHFLHLDPFPWGQVQEGGAWARFGIADREAIFGMTVEVLRRPWATFRKPAAGNTGLLYDIDLHCRPNRPRYLNVPHLLCNTSALHKHMVHICLSRRTTSIRLTIPARLGAKPVIEIVERFCREAHNSLVPGEDSSADGTTQKIADTWPEYILGPENPLTFLSPDMPCSFFDV